MKKKGLIVLAAFSLAVLTLWACGGGGGGSDPVPGTLAVTVTEKNSDPVVPVEGARVAVIDGETGAPVDVLVTDAEGKASITQYEAGKLLFRVSAQGYASSPASLQADPLPFDLVLGQVNSAAIELDALPDSAASGWISGKVMETDGVTGVPWALVVCDNGTASVSTSTDAEGGYALFNLTEGTADLAAWRAGYNFAPVTDVTVTTGAETAAGNIVASATPAAGSVSGHITFLAVTNGVVDVTLIEPKTRAVVPGLRTFNEQSGNTYLLQGVPDGTFEAVASLETDGYVLDPDAVVKFGVPIVTVAGGPVVRDFDVTDAVPLTAPVNRPILPLDNAVFSWEHYPSYSDYVVEVIDESGDVIWGGFDPVTKAKLFTTTAETATFDSDDSALTPLEEGKSYRVRVYASKDDQNEDLGWKLISASENLEGVFVAGPSLACADGVDNDADGWIDAADPDCSPDRGELGFGTTQCNDGSDNDGDSVIDADDPECTDALDDDEAI